MNISKIVSVIVVVVILAVGGYFVFKSGAKPVVKAETVATVNGVAIPKSDFDAQLATAVSNAQSQGVDVTNAAQLAQIKTQVLNDLINNELVNQGIKSAGITVTPAEIDAQLQTIITQSGGADKYQQALTSANITEAQLKDNISKQLLVQKYLAANVDTKSITASDAEISQFYKDYSAQQKTASSTIKIPALKDLSDQIKQQIISNKQQTLVNDFVTSLRNKAQISTTTAAL